MTDQKSESKEIVQVGSIIYDFPRLSSYETDKSYNLRKKYFMKAMEETKASLKTEKDYWNSINMSIVYANTIILKCVYKKDVMDLMNKYL
jgi:hypothetical protein